MGQYSSGKPTGYLYESVSVPSAKMEGIWQSLINNEKRITKSIYAFFVILITMMSPSMKSRGGVSAVHLLLPEECKTTHLKSCDCLLNDCQAEIKTVEGDGHWAVRTKIYDSIKQGAEILILYFPQTQLFSIDRIIEGWQMNDDYIREYQPTMRPISRIIAVVGSSVMDITKPSG